MPIVQITLLEGRNEEQKAKLSEAVTDAIVDSIGAPKESVRVVLYEVPKSHFSIGGKTAKALGR